MNFIIKMKIYINTLNFIPMENTKEAVGVCYFTKRSEPSKKKLGVQKLGGHPSNLVFRSEGALEMINGLEKLYDEQGILIIENKYVEGKIVE